MKKSHNLQIISKLVVTKLLRAIALLKRNFIANFFRFNLSLELIYYAIDKICIRICFRCLSVNSFRQWQKCQLSKTIKIFARFS